MNVTVNRIYSEYFNGQEPKDWSGFRSTPSEIVCPKTIDFSVGKSEGLAHRVAIFAIKIIFIPWGLYSATKWLIQRLIMVPVYPAQSEIVKYYYPQLKTEALDERRSQMADSLSKKGFIIRHVCLQKDGRKISGLLATHPTHSQNGRWVIQACGNLQPIEYRTESIISDYYHKKNFNVLLINNPGIGRSEGVATPATIGENQETGIRFLETALKAKVLVLAGFSLGGAAMGQAILRHEFDQKNIKYLAIRQMTFDRVSNACEKKYREFLNHDWPQKLIAPLVRWAGCEMDSVEASKKLQKLGVPEVIIQRGDCETEFDSDGTIPKEATLGHCLHQEGVLDNKKFVRLQNADHLDAEFISLATVDAMHGWLEECFGSSSKFSNIFSIVTRPFVNIVRTLLQ